MKSSLSPYFNMLCHPLLIICLVLGIGCLPLWEAALAANLEKVIFIPQWLPQAQFAGYYMAYEKGFYRQHGLAVEIRRGGPHSCAAECVQNFQADFGTMFLTAGIEKRAQGIGIINIAQIVQKSGLLLVSQKKHGILRPQDLMGKRVGLWAGDFQIQPRLFFHKYNLFVKIIPMGEGVNLFLRQGLDATSAMRYNEYHLLLNSGLNPEELTVFDMAEHGFDFPEDGIYCLEETWRRHPSRCRAFVAASLAGWRYAFAHPEETLDIVMRYVTEAHIKTNRVHQKWMLAQLQELIEPPGKAIPMGLLVPQTYRQVAQELQNYLLIKTIPPYEEFYRDCQSDVEKR
ncbi:MAG TPA: ABC transporter substrate-binding protein [Desulfobacterales bacterium]|nr:ABC transporter substrate-binding protein [Desulfobacterales bacterium]